VVIDLHGLMGSAVDYYLLAGAIYVLSAIFTQSRAKRRARLAVEKGRS